MTVRIPHSRPFVGSAEKAACARTILSGQLAQGPEVEKLERELAVSAGHAFGICVSSGTAALYCGLRALGVGPSDSVVIPSYVCTALLNAVLMVGAQPVLSDVDPSTGNMDAGNVKRVARRTTKAVIVPHLFGLPAAAHEIEQRLGLPVVEDCAQCVGTSSAGRTIGSLTTLSIFSFYATKLLCAGEGGMVATSDRRIAGRIVDIREYDNRNRFVPAFNFKLSDVHASIARVQLHKLPAAVQSRRSIARGYGEELAALSSRIRVPDPDLHAASAFHRFVVRVAVPVSGVIKRMEKAGIACRRPVYKPLHHYLKKTGFAGSDEMHRHALSLPIYPGLKRHHIHYISRMLARATEQG